MVCRCVAWSSGSDDQQVAGKAFPLQGREPCTAAPAQAVMLFGYLLVTPKDTEPFIGFEPGSEVT